MFLLFLILSVALVLVLALKLVAFLISEKSLLLREELSSYECGFEHHNVSRVPFSLRYFFFNSYFSFIRFRDCSNDIHTFYDLFC